MANTYYAGHDFQWMNEFMKIIQEKQNLKRVTTHCIAEAIHHQYIYKKQTTFKLSHKTLLLFGVDRRLIKPYLQAFQQAGLLKYTIKNGKIPTIILLLIPTNTSNTTNKTTNKT